MFAHAVGRAMPSEFDSAVRKRGQSTTSVVHVIPFESPPREFDAMVTGEKEYHVVLDWGLGQDGLGVCCTCPYYEDKGPCKHIWATILSADRLKKGPKGRSKLELLALDPENYEWPDEESPN